MADWTKVTWDDLLKALNKLVKPGIEGRYVFDVTIFDDAGNPDRKFGITVEAGEVSIVEGETGDPDAVVFHIKRGGIETMRAMQVEGLDAAMRFMFDGSIYTNNPAGAQKWFDIFILGQEALDKALG